MCIRDSHIVETWLINLLNKDKINKKLCEYLSKEINPPNNIIPDLKTFSVSVEWAGSGKILSYRLVISEDETLKSLRNKIHELLPKNIWYDPNNHKIFLGHGGHELASLDQINNGDTLVVLPDLKNMIEFGCESIVLSVAFSPNGEIIAAGYKDRMDKFFSFIPGMSSRIGNHIEFPNYEAEELLSIAKVMVRDLEYEMSPAAEPIFFEYIKKRMTMPYFSNARTDESTS